MQVQEQEKKDVEVNTDAVFSYIHHSIERYSTLKALSELLGDVHLYNEFRMRLYSGTHLLEEKEFEEVMRLSAFKEKVYCIRNILLPLFEKMVGTASTNFSPDNDPKYFKNILELFGVEQKKVYPILVDTMMSVRLENMQKRAYKQGVAALSTWFNAGEFTFLLSIKNYIDTAIREHSVPQILAGISYIKYDKKYVTLYTSAAYFSFKKLYGL